MSTDIINAAGQATRSIKLALREIKIKLETMDTSANPLGVLNDRWLLLADLDEIDRHADYVRKMILSTQWPTQAEYAEV